ncbi:MAG: hypothetical protein Q8Q82_14865 [Hydrogenophaga sp.]|nr:hypothetical protein [Hydrogenophaga sp.]
MPPLLWAFFAICALPVVIWAMMSTGRIKSTTASSLVGALLLFISGAFVVALAIHIVQTGETPQPSKQGGTLGVDDHWLWHSIAWAIWLAIAVLSARAGWSMLRGSTTRKSDSRTGK